MIVADASAVLVALTVDADAGDAVRAQLVDGGPLHAPHVVDLEVLSAIRGLASAGKLDDRRAAQALQDWVDTLVVRYAHHPFARRIWELRHNLTTYDAVYVALAETLGCPLLTADEAFRKTPAVGCEVILVRPSGGVGYGQSRIV